MKVLFLYGWRSVPGGVKPTFLVRHGHEVVNPKLPDNEFVEAVRIAQSGFDSYHPGVVVGSSRGVAVAMNSNSGEAQLVLLYPAWKRHGTARTVKPGTLVLPSRATTWRPSATARHRSVTATCPPRRWLEVGRDHRLADPAR